MKKRKFIGVRFDEHMSMKIGELSDMLKCDKSTVIRMLCLKSIKDMQDKDGYWKIPEGKDEE